MCVTKTNIALGIGFCRGSDRDTPYKTLCQVLYLSLSHTYGAIFVFFCCFIDELVHRERHANTYTHTHTHTRTHAHTHICMYIYIYTYIHIYIHAHTYIYIQTLTHTHIQIHTLIHTHTHTHTHTWLINENNHQELLYFTLYSHQNQPPSFHI